METKRIAIFASGGGSNAIKLLDYFENSASVEVVLLLTNNENAGVLEKTTDHVDQLIINNKGANDGAFLTETMQELGVDYIVLAGYLRKIPAELIHAFPHHIINIHPALLPKYGGKGMYGMKVHNAVFENKEKQSGITIHVVNEVYDEGKIIAQHTVDLGDDDSPEQIKKKVLEIEHKFFSKEVEAYVLGS